MTFLLNHIIRDNKIGNYATWKVLLGQEEHLNVFDDQNVKILKTEGSKTKYIFLGKLEDIINAYNSCIDNIKNKRPAAPFKKYA